jgi:hypothetical protein
MGCHGSRKDYPVRRRELAMAMVPDVKDMFGYNTKWQVENSTTVHGIEVVVYYVTLYIGQNVLEAVEEELTRAQLFSTTKPVELTVNGEKQEGVYEIVIIAYESEVNVMTDAIHMIQKRLGRKSDELILW